MRFQVRRACLKARITVLACMVLLWGGVAWAQDSGTGTDLGLGIIGTLVASTLVPFLASLINQRGFSSTLKGWIATGLSVVAAVVVTFATGGFAPQAFSSEQFIVTAGAILVLSQNIHRLFGKAFSDLENSTPLKTSPPASRSATPPPREAKAELPSLEKILRDAVREELNKPRIAPASLHDESTLAPPVLDAGFVIRNDANTLPDDDGTPSE